MEALIFPHPLCFKTIVDCTTVVPLYYGVYIHTQIYHYEIICFKKNKKHHFLLHRCNRLGDIQARLSLSAASFHLQITRA